MFDARATATGVLDRPDCDPAWPLPAILLFPKPRVLRRGVSVALASEKWSD